MKKFIVNDLQEKYNTPGEYEGFVSVYDSFAETTLIYDDELEDFVEAPIDASAHLDTYHFEYNKNTDKFAIDDYGAIRDEFLKEEKVDIYQSIRDAVEHFEQGTKFNPISEKVDMKTYPAVLEMANEVLDKLRNPICDNIEMNFGRLYDFKGTNEKISIMVLEEMEEHLDVIKAAMLPDYDISDPDELKALQEDLMELITEMAEKITNSLSYSLSKNEHFRFEMEGHGVVDVFASPNRTMLSSETLSKQWEDGNVQEHMKNFVRENLLENIEKDNKAIMLFEFKKGIANIEDTRPAILIEGNWTKINAIISEDKAFAFSNIQEISVDDFMNKYFDVYYDMNYRNVKNAPYQHIGATDVDFRNTLYYIVSESNSQYLKDSFDLVTEKGLRDAVTHGFELQEVRKNMNRFEQYQAKEIIEDLYAEFQKELDAVNKEREEAGYAVYEEEDLQENLPAPDER